MTMTIVGYDPRTGQFGGAVATKNPAVGTRVLRGMGEVGMVGFSSVETQRRRGIAMLQLGFPAPVVLEALIKVSEGAGQYSLIDRNGTPAAYSSPSLRALQVPYRLALDGQLEVHEFYLHRTIGPPENIQTFHHIRWS